MTSVDDGRMGLAEAAANRCRGTSDPLPERRTHQALEHGNPLGPLLAITMGDVVAFRDWAKTVLDPFPAPPAVHARARLILTALGLHLADIGDGEPGPAELVRMIGDLCLSEPEWRRLTRSPSLFVQYAAAEILESHGQSLPAFQLILRALHNAWAKR